MRNSGSSLTNTHIINSDSSSWSEQCERHRTMTQTGEIHPEFTKEIQFTARRDGCRVDRMNVVPLDCSTWWLWGFRTNNFQQLYFVAPDTSSKLAHLLQNWLQSNFQTPFFFQRELHFLTANLPDGAWILTEKYISKLAFPTEGVKSFSRWIKILKQWRVFLKALSKTPL